MLIGKAEVEEGVYTEECYADIIQATEVIKRIASYFHSDQEIEWQPKEWVFSIIASWDEKLAVYNSRGSPLILLKVSRDEHSTYSHVHN